MLILVLGIDMLLLLLLELLLWISNVIHVYPVTRTEFRLQDSKPSLHSPPIRFSSRAINYCYMILFSIIALWNFSTIRNRVKCLPRTFLNKFSTRSSKVLALDKILNKFHP